MTIDELKYNDFIPADVMVYALTNCESHPRFCSWISEHNKELVIRTFGFQKKAKGTFKITEVMRVAPSYDGAIIKNLYYTSLAGYRVVFDNKDVISKSVSYYGYGATLFYGDLFEKWDYTSKPCRMESKLINKEDLFEIAKYKYCGYSAGDIIEYTRAYNEHPEVEYIGKMGLVYKKALMDKVKKDRQFIRFLKNNVVDINYYGPQASIYAYDHKCSIAEAKNIITEKMRIQRTVVYYAPVVKEAKLDAIKVYDYCMKQQDKTEMQVKMSLSANCYSQNQILRIYDDYIRAMLNIGGFDLTDTKNVYPNDLSRMHDVRVDQWASVKAQRDKASKRELNKQFREKAKEALGYAFTDGNYCIVIPEKIKDLVREGNILHHCVGKMGYDAKMARGETLIVFVRKASDPTQPYVTVEWKDKKIKQCYAHHDSRPDAETRAFVDKWAEWMNRKAA